MLALVLALVLLLVLQATLQRFHWLSSCLLFSLPFSHPLVCSCPAVSLCSLVSTSVLPSLSVSQRLQKESLVFSLARPESVVLLLLVLVLFSVFAAVLSAFAGLLSASAAFALPFSVLLAL